MRILYVSQYFPPEMGAPGARVSELSRHWVERGHEVAVLTGFPNHPTGEIHPDYRASFRRMTMRENRDGITVIRTWLWPLPNRKSMERILNYSSFCVSAILRGLFLKRADVVIGTSPQLLAGLAGWVIARVRRTRFILEVRDIWPDAILASGVGREGSLLARALSGLSRFLYRRADHIVVVTPAFETELITKWDVPPEKLGVVQNGVETELFQTRDARSLRADLEIDDRFVVAYVGTLGLAHGLKTILEAASLARSDFPELFFLVVGEGADRESLEREARTRGLDNLRFLGQRPRGEIPALIAAADACVVLLKKAKVFETVIPTKMLEFMACATPVILGVEGQARDILEAAGGGIPIPPEEPAALVAAAKRLNTDDNLARELGRSGRSYVVENLSRRTTADQFLELMEELQVGWTN